MSPPSIRCQSTVYAMFAQPVKPAAQKRKRYPPQGQNSSNLLDAYTGAVCQIANSHPAPCAGQTLCAFGVLAVGGARNWHSFCYTKPVLPKTDPVYPLCRRFVFFSPVRGTFPFLAVHVYTPYINCIIHAFRALVQPYSTLNTSRMVSKAGVPSCIFTAIYGFLPGETIARRLNAPAILEASCISSSFM